MDLCGVDAWMKLHIVELVERDGAHEISDSHWFDEAMFL